MPRRALRSWWLRDLTLDAVRDIWANRTVDDDVDVDTVDFDTAYEQRFTVLPDEETFNAEHKLTIVASTLDTGTPRILEYLADDYNVPINAVLFDHFVDDGREYLSRTWLRPPAQDEAKPSPKRSGRGQRKTWNRRDVFIPLGRADDDRTEARWFHGLKYGFAGAGGGAPYWKFLRNIEPGMRVFGYVGGAGYVAVGEATGPMVPVEELVVEYEGRQMRFVDTPDCPPRFKDRIAAGDPDISEYAVPVDWQVTRTPDDAFFESGMLAQQLPCRLKDTATVAKVEAAFGLGVENFSDLPVTDRLATVGPEVRSLFEEVEKRCTAVGLTRADTKWYVNFVDGDSSPVVAVVVRKNSLKVYVDHDLGELTVGGWSARDVSDVGHHGSGNTEITLKSSEDLEALQLVLDAA